MAKKPNSKPDDRHSPVMQPEKTDKKVEAANVTPGEHGDAPTSSVNEPGLSPAFHDSDLVTDFADTAPDKSPTGKDEDGDDSAKPKPANTPGRSIADEQPTDEAQGRYDKHDSNVTTCPVCQARFTPGDAVL